MLALASIGSSKQADCWDDHRMERFIAGLVKDFERGKLDRREFCQRVALAAVVYGTGEAATAQATRGFKMIGINHTSCPWPDHGKARDYSTPAIGLEST